MTFERKDFKDSLAEKHHAKQQSILPMARLVSGAAPVMDKLARTDEWVRYCTYLQGISERYAAQKQVALQRLGDPAVIKDEDVRKLRQDIFIADVTIDTMRFAIELPGYILKGGEEADKFVSNFEKKNETPGNA